MRRTFDSPLVVAIAVLGCSQFVDQGTSRSVGYWSRAVGFVDSGGISTSPLVAPDTVQAGVGFTVTVSTFGSSACIRPDQSQVQFEGSVASITPYDSVWSNKPPCPGDWRGHPRPVELRFDAVGSARIELHGRGFDHNLTLERTIIVQP
jgi:hypothetical protein